MNDEKNNEKKVLEKVLEKMNEAKIFMNKKYSRTVIIAVAAVIVLAIIGLIINGRQEGNKESQTIAQEKPVHNCAVGTFSKTIQRGESVTFDVLLEKSRLWPKYRVKLGNLPREVIGTVSGSEGRGDGRATINISVGENAKLASYSLVIIYEENKGNDEFEPSYCQYNLIVK